MLSNTLAELEPLIDFNKPVKVDFHGDGLKNEKWIHVYSINDFLVEVNILREFVNNKQNAVWHFGHDALRTFIQEI